MIVTIDGPAGTGKSTVARQIARQLGWMFLDTGAMYRTVAMKVRELGVDPADITAFEKVCETLDLDFKWSDDGLQVLLDGRDVTDAIRTAEITEIASNVATVRQVRSALVAKQRELARRFENVVTEGRDQGSVVFPDAELKVYLDASPQERARRRCEQFDEHDRYEAVLEAIKRRDDQDQSRQASPLVVPDGAERIDTTDMTFDEVVSTILKHIEDIRSN